MRAPHERQLTEIGRLAKSPASEKELSRVKTLLKFSYYSSLATNSGKAYFLGKHETVMGSFTAGTDLHESLNQVTAADVQRVAKTYFSRRNRTVITGVPK